MFMGKGKGKGYLLFVAIVMGRLNWCWVCVVDGDSTEREREIIEDAVIY